MVSWLIKLFIFLFFNRHEKQLAREMQNSRILVLNYFVQRVFGSSSMVPYSVHFTSKVNQNKNGLQIEKNSTSVLISLAVSGGCYISIAEGTNLKIGENTIFAPQVSIVTGNHGLLNRDEYTKADVEIGKNCWLGKGVCIMPGVKLGDNVTVGANAVVTKSFSSNLVIGGIPARVIKTAPPSL